MSICVSALKAVEQTLDEIVAIVTCDDDSKRVHCK